MSDKDCLALNKMNVNFGNFYSKAHQPILFRNKSEYQFGRITSRLSDLCYPIVVEGHENMQGYELPYGKEIDYDKIWTHIWNYSFTFKTEEVTKQHFWRFVRAWKKYYNDSTFGNNADESFDYFIKMMRKQYENGLPNVMKPEMHPKQIKEHFLKLKPEQCRYNLFGKL